MDEKLTCQECGKKYPWSEFVEIQKWIDSRRLFPQYKELLVCWECWSKNHV